MRDILTVIAGLLVIVLAAALIAPPLIDWEARREFIDRALSEAAGVPARTDGRIEVRLLPSPRLRVDDLRLGSGRPEDAALAARFVKAEIALTPLFQGEVRFTTTRIGRAEVRFPTSADGDWRIPPAIASGEALRRGWAFEDLRVAQLLVTTVAPATGRTDQFFAENVRVEGQSLAGPWRVEGVTKTVPFRLATGELGADRTMQVRLAGGGDLHPRFDVDAKLALGSEGAVSLGVSGTARVLFGPPAQSGSAGVPLPLTVQTSFKTAGRTVELDPVSVETGEGAPSLRLTGTGVVRPDEPRLSLKLEGRRLDLDSFLLSPAGQELRAQPGWWSLPPIPFPVDLDLSLNSIGLAQEELTELVLKTSLSADRAKVERLALVAPGQSRLALEGDVGLTTEVNATGRVSVTSASTERLLRFLSRLDLVPSFATTAGNQALEASADFNVAPPVAGFRNLRVKFGDAAATGSGRYTAPEESTRGKLEAQLGVQGLDLNDLPRLGSVFDATRNLDVGFVLDARGLRYGAREGAGRIAARIVSDGPALFVETLDIVDLAGANARVSGRIAPDGSGRIAGKVTARRAAPLVDLLGSVWAGGVTKLVPPFLREGDLDLDVVAERAGPDPRSAAPRLRTTAKGRAAGGPFEADLLSIDGAADDLTIRLATQNTGAWLERANTPALRRPASLELKGVRAGSGQFNITASGDLAGVGITTPRPFALGSGDAVVDSGELALATADSRPFAVLLGEGAGADAPVPAQLRVTLGRQREGSTVAVAGKIADSSVEARLLTRSRTDTTGSATLDRLSLPWLLSAFALNTGADPRPAAPWSTARFGERGNLVGGQVAIKVGQLDLGRGHRAQNAGFTLAIGPEGAAVRDLAADLAGGRLQGALNITRQGSLASFIGEGSLRDASLTALLGPSQIGGKISGTLRFGASGETPAAIVTNLSGGGDLRLAEIEVPNADPGSLARAVPRALADAEPLVPARLTAILSEELNRGPLRVASAGAPATMVAGVLRASPVEAEAGSAAWQGAVSVDLKTLALDARGTLVSKTAPKAWTGSPPSVGLGWRGGFASLSREIEVGPLLNGLAAVVLQRELEKIEAFQAEANEQARLNGRREMDRARERDRLAAEEAARQARIREQQAAEEAARQARAREEAERQARIREQQEAERQARLREEARQARIREQAERARAVPIDPQFFAPLDIRPPALSRPPG